jgi:hypothetical protein
MRGKAVPQRMRMNRFLETGTLRRFVASMPNGFRIDGAIPAMVGVAREEPNTRLSPQSPPVFPEFLEQAYGSALRRDLCVPCRRGRESPFVGYRRR